MLPDPELSVKEKLGLAGPSVIPPADAVIFERLWRRTDNIDDEVGVREHRDVAAVNRMSGRSHAFRYEALQIGVDSAVMGGHNVPDGLDFQATPGAFSGRRDPLPADNASPRQPSALARKGLPQNIATPSGCIQTRPSATSMWPEYVGGWEFALLALKSHRHRGNRRDIDQPYNTVVGSRSSDDAPAVGVADKDSGAADPSQRRFTVATSLSVSIEAVLGGYHFVSLRLKWGNHLTKA